jgi:hypothetical protein
MTFKIEIDEPGKGKMTERLGVNEFPNDYRAISNPEDAKQSLTAAVVGKIHFLSTYYIPDRSYRNVEIVDSEPRVFKLGEITVTIVRE